MSAARRAFTLIELLVVIAIIAILLAIVMPAVARSRDLARRTVCGTNVRSIVQAFYNYSVGNDGYLPMNQGSEPSYVYVRGSTLIQSPGNEWHLGEYLMPEMSMTPPPRGAGNKFELETLRNTRRDGRIFYCPATRNAFEETTLYPGWANPSAFGSFMDYAQCWNFIGPASVRDGNRLYAISQDGVYRLIDENGNPIPGNPDEPNDISQLYQLPQNASGVDHLRIPNSGAEVPVLGEYVTSFDLQVGAIGPAFANGSLQPRSGNHPWTGRAQARDLPIEGGNFGYIDGRVEWKPRSTLRPRLLIDRIFSGGSNRPCYWW